MSFSRLIYVGHNTNKILSCNCYLKPKMWFLIFLIGSVISNPIDELGDIINEGELAPNDEAYLMEIVPSGYTPSKLQKQIKIQLFDIVDKENENYKLFNEFIEKGYTIKGLTFNIYDDSMREASIALFRLLQNLEDDQFQRISEWASLNINKDMFEYAVRLVLLYNNKFNYKELQPPFVSKPNYFVNAETIIKALKLKINNGHFNQDEAKLNQFYRTDDIISINTNYSGWNFMENIYDAELNYFREDIGLNSFYYGIHLLHPFWMSNEELDEMNPRHAEHYYFSHQQLMARYILEKEHLKYRHSANKNDGSNYNPYLVYDNGLPFPSRSLIKKDWNEDKAQLKSIDIAIKECISRGLIIMDNGTTISMTEDNHIELLAKLIRANLDGIKMAKIVRSLYGGNGHPVDEYNPAPSILHHPQTSLRDPVYWHLIQIVLNYFTDYKNSMEPYDLSDYETEDIKIIDHNFTKITTYFDHYQFNINKALQNENYNYIKSPLVLTARQKRLKHLPFKLNFTIVCTNDKKVVVRLFLGPQCYFYNCWQNFSQFYELDNYNVQLKGGSNILSWSPETSNKLSFDDYFNFEILSKKDNKYNLFKFPENLLVPRGLEEGLNLTLFIIITPAEVSDQVDFVSKNNFYRYVSYEVDRKPLGFPFHREAVISKYSDKNYKFYNISIFHKNLDDKSGYFSQYLY